MSTPLISVITVVYNGAARLRPTMEGVIAQLTEGIEYIVVDGGSTDGTVEIIREFEPSLTRWISEPDRGIYDAMNKAIDLATGDYLYFLNAGDTFYSHNVMEKAAQLLKQDKMPDVLIGRVAVTGGREPLYPVALHPNRISNPRTVFPNNVCHQALFVRRDRILAVGKFQTRFRICADFHNAWTIMSSGQFVYYPDFIVANYGLDGISADGRNAVAMIAEQEAMFTDLGYPASRLYRTYRLARGHFHAMRMKWRHR